MTNVYNNFEKAIKGKTCYAIFDCVAADVNNPNRAAWGKAAFIASSSGLSLKAFIHVFGYEMQEVVIKGCGFDRQTEAFIVAFDKLKKKYPDIELPEMLENGHWDNQLYTKGFCTIEI